MIAASVDLTSVPFEGAQAPSHKVIADHLRASSFLIADGVLPANEGRGYVLRRIMRRAMRHAHLLGARDPMMYRLVPVLVREMGTAYPELLRAQALITETLKLEETRFRKTLERGLGLLADESEALTAGDVFSGEVAFKLYDTYGFPLDLTQDALRARGVGVDTDAFNIAMERQRSEARAAWRGSGEAATEAVWFDLRDRLGATEFLGYETERAEGVVTAIVREGAPVDRAVAGDDVSIIVNQTPFYGESGGQVGDAGTIKGADGATIEIERTEKKLGDLFVHLGRVVSGSVEVGAAVELDVDHERRSATRANHSATHIVHEALRQVLGDHVAQKGSLVAPERLRFDFSHHKPIEADELARIERLSNRIVAQNDVVETRLMAIDEALETGAMALFGEKYGEEVRVVAMGRPDAGSTANRPWSIELCGGTHVARTGDIGLVHIVAESASAAGVRRIEALTGERARSYLVEQDARIRELASLLRTRPEDSVARVAQLIDERRALERQIAELKKQVALGAGGAVAGPLIEDVGGVQVLARQVQGLDPKDLRGLVDDGKRQLGSGIVVVVGPTEDGKAGVAVGVTGDLAGRFNAVDLVKAAAVALGGKGGGGRADMAQAGGPDGSKAAEALSAVRDAIVERSKSAA